jgi:hypothetical protein
MKQFDVKGEEGISQKEAEELVLRPVKLTKEDVS